MSLETRLLDFIKSEQNSGLVLRGGWGQGKTHLWKSLAEQHAKEGKGQRPNYAYVSLFGVNSLADLRNALAVKVRPVDQLKNDTFLALLGADQPVGQKWHKFVAWIRRKGQASAELLSGNPGINVHHVSANLGPLLLTLAYTRLKKALVVIDDIERRGKGLELKDVLGLIADLVNERNCSVLAILNDATLEQDDQKTWDANREKVFMGEVRLQTSSRRSIGYVYRLDTLSADEKVAVDAIESLNIANVRIIQRIKQTIEQVFACLPTDLLPDTRSHVIHGVALIVYVHTGQGEGAPPPEMIRRSQLSRDVSDHLRKASHQPVQKSEEETSWGDLLRNYHYPVGGHLDDILNSAATDGFPDEERLQDAVQDIDDTLRKEKKSQALSDAWDLFRNRVGDNSQEVIDAMYNALMACADHVSVNNADSAILLVRKLDATEKANEMVEAWVKPRRNQQRWKELSPNSISMFGNPNDEMLAKSIETAFASLQHEYVIPLDQAMQLVINGESHSEAAVQGLSEAKVNEYLAYFRKHGLDRIVPRLLQYPSQANLQYGIIHKKLLLALRELSKGPLIDRLRVERVAGPIEDLPDPDKDFLQESMTLNQAPSSTTSINN